MKYKHLIVFAVSIISAGCMSPMNPFLTPKETYDQHFIVTTGKELSSISSGNSFYGVPKPYYDINLDNDELAIYITGYCDSSYDLVVFSHPLNEEMSRDHKTFICGRIFTGIFGNPLKATSLTGEELYLPSGRYSFQLKDRSDVLLEQQVVNLHCRESDDPAKTAKPRNSNVKPTSNLDDPLNLFQ